MSFLNTSCAHKRSVAINNKGNDTITASQIRYHFLVISKTMHISKFFIEEKVLKNLFSISASKFVPIILEHPVMYALSYFTSPLEALILSCVEFFF